MKNAICYFFSFLVEAIILWQYSSNLFSAKRKLLVKLITLCCLYFILFFCSLFESIWLNVALYFLLNFIFLVIQFYLNWYTALFHSSILTAVMSMSELIVYGIIKRFAPHFLDNGREFNHLLVFTVFNKLIFFTVIYLLIHFIKKQEKCSRQYDKSIFLLVFIPIASVFVMFTFINIGENATLPPSLDWMITLSAVFLLTANLLMFGINQYHQKKNMEFTEMQLLLQQESDSARYYEMLHLQNENQRILIHDMKKHLQSIALLNEDNQNEKIRAYIDQLMQSSDLLEFSKICDHKILNNILCRYKKVCNDLHIAFHADIRSNTTAFLSDSDVTSLFCNLLDNAVEASQRIKASYIEISATQREHTPFIIITMINSCACNPFSPNGELISSKPDPQAHGFGIKSIEKIVHNYNGNMQMYYDEETFTFHTIIMLKMKP